MSYKTLLAAYPARLRRKHGPELIETMLEMAGPGGRPARADQRRLVLDGLRERFRPPARRPFALVAVVIALLIGGALGAAVGSWLGTFGYAALPGPEAFGFDRGFNSEHYFWAQGSIPAGTDAQQAAEQMHEKLTTDGWTVGPIISEDGRIANTHFAAESAGVRVDVYAYPLITSVDVTGWPQRPASYLPLTIAGTLLGLVAGWLAGVALAHRIRAARHPAPSAALAIAGLLLVIPSAAGFVASLLRYLTVADPQGTGELVHSHGFAFGPTIDLLRAHNMGEGWLLTPSDFQQLPLWGFALIAIAALVARPTRDQKLHNPTAA
ncbi:hypothetical protein AB0J83_29410 [Actinoplanes sp. NPDC049596]|uniref:hypothetical protein n=1 Tax=unclassified Actinoplanes TaxID=2626549 RepID=UPI00343C9433